MALNRLNTNRFHNDSASSLRTAQLQLNFIITNKQLLCKIKNGSKLIAAVQNFSEMIRKKENLTNNQKAFIDGIYEKVWHAAGFTAYSTKHDIRRNLL